MIVLFSLILPLVLLALVVITFTALFVGEASRLWKRGVAPPRKVLALALCGVALVPLVFIVHLLGSFAVANFPFTSGVVAHASSPDGVEACVVQTFKGAEPYQVSLYARRDTQAWVWHYLAHQDRRWRTCRIEFADGQLRVYRDSALRRSWSVSDATDMSDSTEYQLPAEFTPPQLAAKHNAQFRY